MATRSTASRRRARRYGLWTEALAAMALRAKGYRILARNFKTKSGEIDIIARKGNLIAFVEVKARRDMMAALDAVGHESRSRIDAAADQWLSKQPDYHLLSQRFDIIAVQPWQWPKHFEDAF